MTPEGKVRQYLKKRCKDAGLEHRKLGWIGRRNAPDEFVFHPAGEFRWQPIDPLKNEYRTDNRWRAPVCAFIECKAEGEVPNPGQEREIKRLRDAGFQVFVVDSEASVDAAIGQLIG